MNEFLIDAKEDKIIKHGWPIHFSGYSVSKVALSILTKIQQKELDKETPGRNILINSCCPGNVDTDMSGGDFPGAITPDEGADTPTFLAMIPQNVSQPKGQFCKLRKPVSYPPTGLKK